MAGRKTKLTPEIQARIVSAIKDGNYACVAARYAGVGERTYYRWMELGEKQPTGPYRQFWQAIRDAEAIAEVEVVRVLHGHMLADWRPCIEFLRGRFQDRWGKKDQLTVKIGRMSTDELDEFITGRLAAEGITGVEAGDGSLAGTQGDEE